MTAEVKQSDAQATTKKRGKRIGPTNLEAKRASALRQAASAAESERRATGITSTVSFIQLLRDAAITGTIPGNSQLIATIRSWRNSAALNAEGLSPTGQKLVQDLKVLADLLNQFLEQRNGDELLQKFLHHVHLASKLAGVNVAIAGWRARGQQRRRMQKGGMQTGGRGKISLWKSADRRQEVFLGGEHSRISGIDPNAEQATTPATVAAETQRQQEKIAKDARALLRIAHQLIVSADFRDLVVRIQRVGRRVVDLAKQSNVESRDQEEEGLEGKGELWGEKETVEPMILGEEESSGSQEFDKELRRLERDEAQTSSHLYHFRINESHESHEPQSREYHESLNDMGRTEENIPIPSLSTASNMPIIEHFEKSRGSEPPAEKEIKPVSSGTTKKSALRTQILSDLRSIFSQLAGNRQFSRAFNDFYAVLLKLRRTEVVGTAALLTEDLRYDANFRAAQDELLVLLERLSGSPGVSLAPLVENLRKVRQESRDDYELRDFLGDWRAFLKRCTGIESQRYIESEEYMRRGEVLLKRTEKYFSPSGQYRSHLDESFDALNAFVEGMRSDKLTRDLGKQVNKLIKEDLIGIGRGEPLSVRTMLTSSALLRPDLLNDVRYHILPRILQSMQSIPLPRIEVVSGGTTLVLEDLIIPADALVPLQMEILTSSHVTMNPKSRLFRRSATPAPSPSSRVEGVQGGVQLKLSSIAGQVRNVRFTMDRHEGWPKFSDQGLADLRIGGRGLTILIDLATHPASEITGRSDFRSSVLPAALIAHHVRVRIDRLSLTLHDSLHDSMYRVFNPIVSSVVKRNMERAIRDQIVNVVDSLDGLLERLSKTVVH